MVAALQIYMGFCSFLSKKPEADSRHPVSALSPPFTVAGAQVHPFPSHSFQGRGIQPKLPSIVAREIGWQLQQWGTGPLQGTILLQQQHRDGTMAHGWG